MVHPIALVISLTLGIAVYLLCRGFSRYDVVFTPPLEQFFCILAGVLTFGIAYQSWRRL
jgi:hypothetical protein